MGEWPREGHPTQVSVKRQVESLRAIGIECHVWNLGQSAVGWRKYLHGFRKMHAYTASQPFDLVHAHYGYCGWVARMQWRLPLVISFMGDDLLGTPNQKGRYKWSSKLVAGVNKVLASQADAVIVKSPQMSQILAPIPCHVVPNGVDLESFSPMNQAEALSLLGLDSGYRYVLFPASPTEHVKGFPLARAVVEKLQKTSRERIKLLVLDRIPHEQVPLYMNACDALLMTSYHEGSPNVIKEGLACNVPIVSVTVGDVPELLRGISGCRVCPHERDVLCAALSETLDRNERIEGRRVLQRLGLDLKTVADRIKGIYQAVRTNRAGSRRRSAAEL